LFVLGNYTVARRRSPKPIAGAKVGDVVEADDCLLAASVPAKLIQSDASMLVAPVFNEAMGQAGALATCRSYRIFDSEAGTGAPVDRLDHCGKASPCRTRPNAVT
jgi:hypothetical protein